MKSAPIIFGSIFYIDHRKIFSTSGSEEICLFERLSQCLDSPEKSGFRVKQEADLAKEAYRLTVTKEGACVYYSTETGLLWGIQTLRQALEQANFFTSGSAKYLPMVDIKDAPKYDWRGFHIDVVRHMFTVDYLKKVIQYI
jgi:hexosaminidase